MKVLPFTHKPNGDYVSILDDMCKDILLQKFSGWYCDDCSFNTYLGTSDYYMVQNDLWDKYGPKHGMLCIACLEKRICRKLELADFTDCPLNKQNSHVRMLKVKKFSRTTKLGISTFDLLSGMYELP